jgi:hypothetical protein
VPDTHAYTHDGQRQVPRDRPDIRAHLTGSFTYVAQRFTREHQSIALVTRHGISSPDARTTTPWRSRRDPRRAIRGLQGAAYRARRKVTAVAAPTKPPVVVRYRRPADRRSRPERWADAVQTLADMLDQFQEWRDNLPSSLKDSATAEALDAVLELRGHVEDLQAVELPKGFGRD